jgi:hypothetical protein
MVRWADWVSFEADWLGEGPDCFEFLCQPYPPRIVSPSDPSELNPNHFANRVRRNCLKLMPDKTSQWEGSTVRDTNEVSCIELRNEPGAMMIGHELYLRANT